LLGDDAVAEHFELVRSANAVNLGHPAGGETHHPFHKRGVQVMFSGF